MTLVALARSQREAVLARDARTLGTLAKEYRPVRDAIAADLDALNARIDRAVAKGGTIGPALLFQQGRAETMLGQVERRIDAYATLADEYTDKAVRDAAMRSIEYAEALIDEATPRGFGTSFTSIREDAMQAAVAQARPVANSLKGVGADSARAIGDTLIDAVSRGVHPRTSAKALARAADIPLNRALTIARTETLRAHRAGTHLRMAESDELQGWIWLAAQQDRTCASCFALHGTKHSLDEPMVSHPNCRCTQMPWVKPWSEIDPAFDDEETPIGPLDGQRAFDKLPQHSKERILGKGGFEAYRRGDVKLADFVGRTSHPLYGDGYAKVSLRQAKLNAGSRTGLPIPDLPPRAPATALPARAAGARAAPRAAAPRAASAPPRSSAPLSAAMNVSPKMRSHARIAQSLDEIDAAMPGLRTLVDPKRMSLVDDLPNAKNAGEMHRISQGRGKPPRVEIRLTTPQSPTAPQTLAHEIGHAIDYAASGRGNLIHRIEAQPVLRAIQESDGFAKLAKKMTGKERAYYESASEAWARAFAQWVIARTPEGAALRGRVSISKLVGQWDDDDFAPIAAALDDLFRNLGVIS